MKLQLPNTVVAGSLLVYAILSNRIDEVIAMLIFIVDKFVAPAINTWVTIWRAFKALMDLLFPSLRVWNIVIL